MPELNQLLVTLIFMCAFLGFGLGWTVKSLADEFLKKEPEKVIVRSLPQLLFAAFFILALIGLAFPIGKSFFGH